MFLHSIGKIAEKILNILKIFAENKIVFFSILSLFLLIFNRFDAAFQKQEDTCQVLLESVNDLEQKIEFEQQLSLDNEIYLTVSEIHSNQIKDREDYSGISSSLSKIERDLRSQSIKLDKRRKYVSDFCGSIDDEKRSAQLIEQIIALLIAVYGFWVGLREGVKKSG